LKRPRSSLARVGALVLTAGAMLGGLACSLVAGLDKLEFEDPPGCVDACDDHNPCTKSDCLVEGVCHGEPVVDGPASTEATGNCQKVECAAGVAGTTIDDTDVPDDDGNSCTTESCAMGTPTHTAKPAGDACTVGTSAKPGVCDGKACVAKCDDDGCDDANPCTIDSCDQLKHLCASTPLDGVPTPGAPAMPGNCRAHVCVVGVDTEVPDDLDVLPSMNDCLVPACMAGTLTLTPKPMGGPCMTTGGQVCDGAGACVACLLDAQCKAPQTCGGGNPGTIFTCGCTKQTCAEIGATCGQPSDGCSAMLSCDSGTKDGKETDVDCGGGGDCATKCAQGKVCKVAGDCASGQCVDGVCCNNACVGACVACNAAGTIGTCTNVKVGLPDPLTCVAPSSCDGSGHCKKAIGQMCAVNFDCGSGFCADGYCCNSACTGTCLSCKVTASLGMCINVPVGQTDANGLVACSSPNACNGAALCKLAAGQACTTAAQCATNMCTASVCQ